MAENHVLLISQRRMFVRSLAKIIQVQCDGVTVADVDDIKAACAELALQPQSIAFLDVEGDSIKEPAGSEHVVAAMQTLWQAQKGLRIVPVYDEQWDEHIETVMEQGAAGVVVKSAPPGVLAEFIDRLIQGQTCRPVPIQIIGAEALSEAMRQRLSARQQKLLRLMLGGESISAAATQLSITRAKVVAMMREINEVIRGKE